MNHDHHHHATAPEMARDPVCGMTVNPERAKHSAEAGGRTYSEALAEIHELGRQMKAIRLGLDP